jgi:hypothetical protein
MKIAQAAVTAHPRVRHVTGGESAAVAAVAAVVTLALGAVVTAAAVGPGPVLPEVAFALGAACEVLSALWARLGGEDR